MDKVIPLTIVSSPSIKIEEQDLRAARDVLAMAYGQRQACQAVIDRLRAKLGLEPDDRLVPTVQ